MQAATFTTSQLKAANALFFLERTEGVNAVTLSYDSLCKFLVTSHTPVQDEVVLSFIKIIRRQINANELKRRVQQLMPSSLLQSPSLTAASGVAPGCEKQLRLLKKQSDFYESRISRARSKAQALIKGGSGDSANFLGLSSAFQRGGMNALVQGSTMSVEQIRKMIGLPGIHSNISKGNQLVDGRQKKSLNISAGLSQKQQIQQRVGTQRIRFVREPMASSSTIDFGNCTPSLPSSSGIGIGSSAAVVVQSTLASSFIGGRQSCSTNNIRCILVALTFALESHIQELKTNTKFNTRIISKSRQKYRPAEEENQQKLPVLLPPECGYYQSLIDLIMNNVANSSLFSSYSATAPVEDLMCPSSREGSGGKNEEAVNDKTGSFNLQRKRNSTVHLTAQFRHQTSSTIAFDLLVLLVILSNFFADRERLGYSSAAEAVDVILGLESEYNLQKQREENKRLSVADAYSLVRDNGGEHEMAMRLPNEYGGARIIPRGSSTTDWLEQMSLSTMSLSYHDEKRENREIDMKIMKNNLGGMFSLPPADINCDSIFGTDTFAKAGRVATLTKNDHLSITPKADDDFGKRDSDGVVKSTVNVGQLRRLLDASFDGDFEKIAQKVKGRGRWSQEDIFSFCDCDGEDINFDSIEKNLDDELVGRFKEKRGDNASEFHYSHHNKIYSNINNNNPLSQSSLSPVSSLYSPSTATFVAKMSKSEQLSIIDAVICKYWNQLYEMIGSNPVKYKAVTARGILNAVKRFNSLVRGAEKEETEKVTSAMIAVTSASSLKESGAGGAISALSLNGNFGGRSPHRCAFIAGGLGGSGGKSTNKDSAHSSLPSLGVTYRSFAYINDFFRLDPTVNINMSMMTSIIKQFFLLSSYQQKLLIIVLLDALEDEKTLELNAMLASSGIPRSLTITNVISSSSAKTFFMNFTNSVLLIGAREGWGGTGAARSLYSRLAGIGKDQNYQAAKASLSALGRERSTNVNSQGVSSGINEGRAATPILAQIDYDGVDNPCGILIKDGQKPPVVKKIHLKIDESHKQYLMPLEMIEALENQAQVLSSKVIDLLRSKEMMKVSSISSSHQRARPRSVGANFIDGKRDTTGTGLALRFQVVSKRFNTRNYPFSAEAKQQIQGDTDVSGAVRGKNGGIPIITDIKITQTDDVDNSDDDTENDHIYNESEEELSPIAPVVLGLQDSVVEDGLNEFFPLIETDEHQPTRSLFNEDNPTLGDEIQRAYEVKVEEMGGAVTPNLQDTQKLQKHIQKELLAQQITSEKVKDPTLEGEISKTPQTTMDRPIMQKQRDALKESIFHPSNSYLATAILEEGQKRDMDFLRILLEDEKVTNTEMYVTRVTQLIKQKMKMENDERKHRSVFTSDYGKLRDFLYKMINDLSRGKVKEWYGEEKNQSKKSWNKDTLEEMLNFLSLEASENERQLRSVLNPAGTYMGNSLRDVIANYINRKHKNNVRNDGLNEDNDDKEEIFRKIPLDDDEFHKMLLQADTEMNRKAVTKCTDASHTRDSSNRLLKSAPLSLETDDSHINNDRISSAVRNLDNSPCSRLKNQLMKVLYESLRNNLDPKECLRYFLDYYDYNGSSLRLLRLRQQKETTQADATSAHISPFPSGSSRNGKKKGNYSEDDLLHERSLLSPHTLSFMNGDFYDANGKYYLSASYVLNSCYCTALGLPGTGICSVCKRQGRAYKLSKKDKVMQATQYGGALGGSHKRDDRRERERTMHGSYTPPKKRTTLTSLPDSSVERKRKMTLASSSQQKNMISASSNSDRATRISRYNDEYDNSSIPYRDMSPSAIGEKKKTTIYFPIVSVCRDHVTTRVVLKPLTVSKESIEKQMYLSKRRDRERVRAKEKNIKQKTNNHIVF